MRIGMLEAGGTKMVCGIGNESGEIIKRVTIPTTTPKETMPKLIAFFLEEGVERLGIGCFGPISPRKDAPDYGYITSTTKLAWQNVNIVGMFEDTLHCPIGFDTDVNAAALGEATFGITRGLSCSIYVTVGTGIGVGVYINGDLLHGMMHTEAGHIMMKKHERDPFAGACPFHGDCLEGLAAGPAIEARWGQKGAMLTNKGQVWELEAYYLAQACVDYCVTYSPQRIVLGGGVMKQPGLLSMIRTEFTRLLAGYIKTPEVADVEHYIVEPSLADNQALLGCLQLALRA